MEERNENEDMKQYIINQEYYKEIQDEINCLICFLVPETPLSCEQCTSLYCQKCMDQHRIQNCSTCRARFGQGRPFKNLILKSFIEKVKCKCKFYADGCKQIIKISNFSDHINQCSHNKNKAKVIQKPYKIEEQDIDGIECLYCLVKINFQLIDHHEKICQQNFILCEICNTMVHQSQIVKHSNECQDQNEQIDFDIMDFQPPPPPNKNQYQSQYQPYINQNQQKQNVYPVFQQQQQQPKQRVQLNKDFKLQKQQIKVPIIQQQLPVPNLPLNQFMLNQKYQPPNNVKNAVKDQKIENFPDQDPFFQYQNQQNPFIQEEILSFGSQEDKIYQVNYDAQKNIQSFQNIIDYQGNNQYQQQMNQPPMFQNINPYHYNPDVAHQQNQNKNETMFGNLFEDNED